MRSVFIILILALLGVRAYAQSKNTLSLVYGEASYNVAIWGAIGDFGYETKKGNIYGLNYSRNINKAFSFETGLNYSNNQAQESSIVGGLGTIYHYGTIKMLSVPAIA